MKLENLKWPIILGLIAIILYIGCDWYKTYTAKENQNKISEMVGEVKMLRNQVGVREKEAVTLRQIADDALGKIRKVDTVIINDNHEKNIAHIRTLSPDSAFLFFTICLSKKVSPVW